MAPGLVTPEKAARGKLPTDVWWHTIVPHERRARRPATRRRSPRASCAAWCRPPSRPGDWCLDFFAGSGTLGAVAATLGRRFVLMDSNPEAVAVAARRLAQSTGSAA